MRIKYEQRNLGFLSAQVVTDGGYDASWSLRVASPAEIDDFRRHLSDGSCMSLTMVTRDGDQLRGEACVANVSDGRDTATLVTLSGMGPLRRA